MSDQHWQKWEAPPKMVFLCEFAGLLPTPGFRGETNVVPPPILAKEYAASADGRIYIAKPGAYGAAFYDLRDGRSFLPFVLPLPSLVVPASDIIIREIPEPACFHWPPYAMPLLAALLQDLTSKSLQNTVADSTHIPLG